MPATKDGFQLTTRDERGSDLDLLRLVFELRCARIDHLSALSGRSPKKVHGRVFELAKRGYLYCKDLPQQKHIYFLDKAGVSVLVEQGIIPSEELDRRLRHHELTELFLKHELMIVDVHVLLMLALREDDTLRLLEWREDRSIWDSVPPEQGSDSPKSRSLCPDARFVLEAPERPADRRIARFFFEADRSSENHKTFMDKLVAYWDYLTMGRFNERYAESRSFRVLTVTRSPERASAKHWPCVSRI